MENSSSIFIGHHRSPTVSLIATVKNEADNIAALLDSMLAQTRPADEIVINDNGSDDETTAIIQRYIDAGHPIRLVSGGFNIPSGRNNAVRHAHGSLIASCDAGLTLPSQWLERIIKPLETDQADFVGGFYKADPQSLWELVLGATNYPDVDEVNPQTFLPAGQSMAFTKAAWHSVGGFPEWAATCEDLIFGMELKRQGYRFVFEPDAAVCFRPRATVGGYVKQYFTYARGDGVANLFPRRHAIRYGSYIALAGILRLAQRWNPVLLLLVPGVAYHTYQPYRRLWPRVQHLSLREQVAALALVPLIRLLGDGAKMLGYPVGIWRRYSPQDSTAREQQL
jgi:glycosyltransferase involved in cell wall biosynthesis